MKKLTDEQYKLYSSDPLGMDEKVRGWCNVLDSRYYTVSVYPIEGEVRVDGNRYREVKAKKISKSDKKD